MTPEGKIKQQIKTFLDSIGAWHYWPVPMGYGRRGIKDCIGCYNGRCFGIETKAANKDLTPWQESETEYMKDAKAWVFDFRPGVTFKDFEREFRKDFGVYYDL